jgi:hypothetical protein
MKALRVFILVLTVVLVQFVPIYLCTASPSWYFSKGHHSYDDWGVSRTNSDGSSGYLQEIYSGRDWPPSSFRPLIAFESLGSWTDMAYTFGEQFAERYPDSHQRAERIFYFVRDRVQYTSDIDQFGVGEFAQNADELANTISAEGLASGDCEDMAILLAIIYQGAGFRSAIADCPGHVGTLLYLPDYNKANRVFELDGEPGWIWCEATGSTNPLGWFPVGQLEGPILAYEIGPERIDKQSPPTIASRPLSLHFSATQGELHPPSQTLELGNAGYGEAAWSLTCDAPWLTAMPSSGVSSEETDSVTLSVDISGMSDGTYSASVTIAAEEAVNSPYTVQVSMDIAPAPGDFSVLPWVLLVFIVIGIMLTIILFGMKRRAS